MFVTGALMLQPVDLDATINVQLLYWMGCWEVEVSGNGNPGGNGAVSGFGKSWAVSGFGNSCSLENWWACGSGELQGGLLVVGDGVGGFLESPADVSTLRFLGSGFSTYRSVIDVGYAVMDWVMISW